MNKTVELVISPTGETNIETKGFTGEECRQASEFLKQTLGQPQQPEQLTAEYYASQSAVTQQKA